MQALKNYLRQLVLAVIAGGALLGYKLYNKGQSHDNIRADLIKMCESEKPCIKAVNKHFDGCFDTAYTVGGRKKGATFNQGQFLSCFNQRAGKVYFSSANQAH